MPKKKQTYAFIDVDIDGARAAYQRCCEFVESKDLTYGLSSKKVEDLNGTERANLQGFYESVNPSNSRPFTPIF